MNKKHHDQLIKKVKEALREHADKIKGAEIFVSADDKGVTLKGIVDNKRERDKAVAIARGVEGVTAVKQEFTILSEQKKPDARNTPHPGHTLTSDDQGCSLSPRVG
jgi:hypothetical protein